MHDDTHSESIVAPAQRFLGEHRLAVMVVGSVLGALVLVVIAMYLYASSGAAQVDFSRPAYKSIREQSKNTEDNYAAFPSTGEINQEILKQFKEKYSYRAERILNTPGFNPDTLNDDVLLLTDPAAEPVAAPPTE